MAQAIADTRPLCLQFGVERIDKVETKKGKEYIRILGPVKRAEMLRSMYAARDRVVSRLFPDNHQAGW